MFGVLSTEFAPYFVPKPYPESLMSIELHPSTSRSGLRRRGTPTLRCDSGPDRRTAYIWEETAFTAREGLDKITGSEPC